MQELTAINDATVEAASGNTPKQKVSDPYVISYLALRKAVGLIGVALPLLLIFGKLLLDGLGIQSSISSYYYTSMRDVFVGGLCSIGIFLFSYRGYDLTDLIAGKLASVFALGVAFFPTTPDVGATGGQRTIGALHLIFAGCFFLTLAFFSIVLFRRTDPAKPPTKKKLVRNGVYLVCGIIMVACIAGIVVVKLLPPDNPVFVLTPVFWFEAIAIWAFGWSWITKGELILADYS
jgi:hypothetical protein